MAITIKKKPAVATSKVEMKSKGETVSETSSQEAVDMGGKKLESNKPWCEITVEASYTHNLGNYQSAKVGVHLMVPCLHNELDEVYDFTKDWVEQ